MRMPTITEPTFSDAELGRLQRWLADLPEPEAPRREPNGRVARVPRPRRHSIIINGDRLRRLMLTRGFSDARSLALAAGLWPGKTGPVAVALDCGELSPAVAGRIARVLGCEVEDFQLGIRTFEPGPARGYIRKSRNGRS